MIIDELITLLGYEIEDDAELDQYKKTLEQTGNAIKRLAQFTAGAVTAIGTATIFTNQQTTEFNNLAKSVSLSSTTLRALGGVAKELGFEMDNVVDLAEELNNKMGESIGLDKPIGAVADAFKILGLNFHEIKKLNPEEQFKAISDRIIELEDKQAAVSAADILFGGEANKIFGQLREQGYRLTELIEKQKLYNFETEQTTKGAERQTKALNTTRNAISSMFRAFSGLVGEAIAPAIESFNEWIATNREFIVSGIHTAVDVLSFAFKGLGVAIMGGAVWGLGAAILSIGKLITKIKQLATIARILFLPMIGLPLLIGAVIVGIILLLEDLYTYFQGGDSMIGEFIDSFRSNFPEAFAIVQSVFNGIVGAFSTVIGAISTLIDWVLQARQSIISGLSEVIEFVVDWYSIWFNVFMAAAHLIQIFYQNYVRPALARARQAIVRLFEILAPLKAIWDAFWNGVGAVIQAAKNVIVSVIDGIIARISSMINFIKQGLSLVKGFLFGDGPVSISAIADRTAAIRQQTERAASAATRATDAKVSSINNGGNTANINANLNFSGNTNYAQGREAGRGFLDMVKEDRFVRDGGVAY